MYRVVGILKIRYLLPPTIAGIYYSAKSKYEELKSRLDPGIDISGWTETFNQSRRTFNQWLEEANVATQEKPIQPQTQKPIQKPILPLMPTIFKSVGGQDKLDQSDSEIKRQNEEFRKEILLIRKKLEKSEKENRALRGSSGGNGGKIKSKRRVKKSLIELYSEVLDELSGYDSTYKIQDHLPKVVVIGDQSSGKTSVLEMIIGARIFPRGGGNMMTRAPVQVTLSEGTYHVARFKDSAREYDLDNETDLAELRREIEERMKQSVEGGKTVSNQVISLTIQGPGIQRMVLVDLPGIIGTNTLRIAPGTKDCIKNMVAEHMENPNAIILCVQDAFLDPEKSVFNDVIGEVDKKGKRTIVVLTKVDLAEKSEESHSIIRDIVEGKLFRMKALGYYAVVAGKDGKNENIQDIKDYEEQFFLTSKLCDKGILNRSQCTTRNLSAKVSECFWGMVKASIEQQADAYKALLINLEAKWNHLFPDTRQLTRDELFYNARNEILDEVARLSRISTQLWNQSLSTQLWNHVHQHIIDKVYIPASKDPLPFTARVDIEFKRWVESLELPKVAIEVAQESIKHQIDTNIVRKDDSSYDLSIYKDLKRAVIYEALNRHHWKSQALDVLKVVQLEALFKKKIPTKQDWDKSIAFLKSSLQEDLQSTSQEMLQLTGHSFPQRWLKWKSTTPEQRVNKMIQEELEKLLLAKESTLTDPDLITVKKNLESHGYEVDDESIQRVWKPYQRHSFLTNEVNRAQDCSKLYYFHENDLDSGTDCNHVLFFSRLMRMLEFTADNLVRQFQDAECRRIEKLLTEVLEEFSEDDSKKATLLSGKRVELAEELRRVKQIKEKLDEFITALNQEDNN